MDERVGMRLCVIAEKRERKRAAPGIHGIEHPVCTFLSWKSYARDAFLHPSSRRWGWGGCRNKFDPALELALKANR